MNRLKGALEIYKENETIWIKIMAFVLIVNLIFRHKVIENEQYYSNYTRIYDFIFYDIFKCFVYLCIFSNDGFF